MTQATTVASLYIAAWNEPDAARRRELIARAWAEDARYVDPMIHGNGQDAIDAIIAGVQLQFPGCRFALRGSPDAYSDRLRFSWTLHGPDGAAIAEGTDFATTAVDGRLRSVTGFIDRAPG
ncbi:MAG TPA: nuclear transport factor 2 family protein [Acidisphaera sp.]|nr:nuclear transport factor 2 family protein [Acidisphaera sp.]